MGRKRNQAQRTKNNVKPSSSSKAADLLGKDASKLVGFISMKQNVFAGKTELLSTDDFECIDPNFQVSLKKLSKKDAVTKQKGLQEIAELCKSSKDDGCKSLLPYWSKVYCTLSLDVDNKVRENLQIAHKILVSNVGRNLAPYLKQIAPIWFISQFDTYPPAASAAAASLSSTFPENKIKEALIFCDDEIFSFIYDHLINQTVQTLSKTDLSQEDSEAKYERIVICCLNGYSHYLGILSSGLSEEINDKFVATNHKLLSSNKYWQFASHKTPLIRAAWYSSLISLCKNCIQFVKDEMKHVVKTVFSNLDEPDPLVLPLIWECVLFSLKIINECKEQVSLEKVIFPKLCTVLEKGGLGNAATIYPNLLPLLSNITDSTTSDKYKFYSKFFHSLRSGLHQPSVKLSHSESDVIINTFLECFRYIIMLHNEEKDFCFQLIKEQLLDMKKATESDISYRSNIRPLYIGIADLIFYWERNKESYPSYTEYLNLLWETLKPSFLDCFASCILDPSLYSYMFYCQHKFLETFLRPHCRIKKKLKVKFEESYEIAETPIIEECSFESNVDKNTMQHLENLGGELLKAYYTYIQDQVSDEFKHACINQLSFMVKLLGFEFFLTSCNLECSEFCAKLHSWLKDDNVPLEPILVLTFVAIASISDEHLKKNLLEDLIQVRPEMLICEAVKLSLTGRKEYIEISSWLKNENVRNVLISYVDSIHFGSMNKSFSVLKFCLISSRKKEYVIGDDTVAKIFEKLSSLIEQAESSEIDLITSLLEDVFKEDTEEFFKNHSQSVFTLLKSIIWKCFTISECSLMSIINTGISCMLNTLDVESCEFKSFIQDCCHLILNSFEKSKNKNGIAELLNVVKVVCNLLTILIKKSEENKRKELCISLSIDLLFTLMNLSKNNWQKSLEEISLIALGVHGNIPFESYVPNNLSFTAEIWNPLKEVVISSYCQTVLFSLKFIFILLGEHIEEKSVENTDESLLLNQDLDQYGTLILDYTYALNLIRTISKYYSSTEQYFISLEFIEPLAPSLKELVQRIDETSHPQLFSLLKERVCDNVLWVQTDEIIRIEFLEKEPVELDSSNERILTQDLEESSLRTLRNKLKLKKKGLESFINYINWKFETYNKSSATSLYNTSINNVGLMDLCLSSEIARFLTELIKYDDSIIEKKTWEFIMNSIAAWALSIEKTQHPKYSKEFVGFIVSFCNLFITFSAYITSDSLPEDSQMIAKEERNKVIRKEWHLFSSDVHSSIFSSWKKYAGQCSKFQMEPLYLLLIENLSNAICHIAQGGKLIFGQTYELISLTKACCELLLSPCPSVQISAFLTLQSISSHLAKLDSGLDENSVDKISCVHLKETLLKTQTVVEALLQDFKPGVMCLVTPYTDSYVYTRAYLLSWLVLLDIFKAADSRVRHLYTCWMKEERILNNLMNSLLHLLPNLVVYASETNAKKIQETFSTSPSFSYSGWTSVKLSALSGFVYIHVLRVLPLPSRIWYSESEPKKRDFIDKFTAPYVSPLLITEEINFALNETKKCDNLSLETLPTARLVNAVFTVEDSKAELGIQLAHNHPFTPPKVDISKSVVSTSQTKNKLKQLTLFPTLQNGSLWDCIIVWKNYLDKKFEGVEECYICYSVLHYGTHQLPKLTCRTCKKRFHSACLYKWFTSSNKSTCPICRNLF